MSGQNVYTQNANEMNPDRARMNPLYKRFHQQVVVDYARGAKLYGVYHAHESNYTREFSQLAGSISEALMTKGSLENVTLMGSMVCHIS